MIIATCYSMLWKSALLIVGTDLVVDHPMAAPCWRSFAFGLEPIPLPRRWFKPPEVIVMVESPLLG